MLSILALGGMVLSGALALAILRNRRKQRRRQEFLRHLQFVLSRNENL